MKLRNQISRLILTTALGLTFAFAYGQSTCDPAVAGNPGADCMSSAPSITSGAGTNMPNTNFTAQSFDTLTFTSPLCQILVDSAFLAIQNGIPTLGSSATPPQAACGLIFFNGDFSPSGLQQACAGDFVDFTWWSQNEDGYCAEYNLAVEVLENTPPTFLNPPGSLDGSFLCAADTVGFGTPMPTAVDACGLLSNTVISDVTVNNQPGTSCVNDFTRTILWEAVDSCMNADTFTVTLTVKDTLITLVEPFTGNPVTSTSWDSTWACAADFTPNGLVLAAADTVSCFNFSGGLVRLDSTVSTGPCPNKIISYRTLVIFDDCGNRDSTQYEWTANDTIPPVFNEAVGSLDVSAQCASDVTAVPAPTATDNCTGNTVTVTLDSDSTTFLPTGTGGTCINRFARVLTYIASDGCGNTDTFLVNINVFDNTPPALFNVPADTLVSCNALPLAMPQSLVNIPFDQSHPTNIYATDNCGIDRIESTAVQSPIDTCSFLITRQWTAFDSCDNFVVKQQKITVADMGGPEIFGVPADITIDCDVPVPAAAMVTAADDCSMPADITITVDSVSTQTNNGSCTDDTYTVVFTYSATDMCGNRTDSISIVNVQDTTAPVSSVMSMLDTFECDLVPPVNMMADTFFTDNCDPMVRMNVYVDTINRVCNNSYLIRRNYQAFDNCNNMSSFWHQIVVIDTTAPTLLSPMGTEIANCDSVPTRIPFSELGYEDNCGVVLGAGPPMTTTLTCNALNSATPTTWTSTQAATVSTGGCSGFPAGDVVVDFVVCMDLAHTWTSDLDIFLVGPSGAQTTLMSNQPGGNTDLGALGSAGATPAQYCFSLNTADPLMGGNLVGSENAPGNYQADGGLGALAAEVANGSWGVSFADPTGGDGGTIDNISLTLTTAPPPPPPCGADIVTSCAANSATPLTWTSTQAFVTSNGSCAGPATYNNIEVCMDLAHTWTSDLDLDLIAPSGASVTLMSGVPGGNTDLGALGSAGSTPAQYCFTSNVTDPFMGGNLSGAENVPGNYQSQSPLSALLGESASGTWGVSIADPTGGDGGTVDNIEIRFISTPPPCVQDTTVDTIFTEVITPGSCPGNYTIVRTYTVSDDCGNSTSNVHTIMVQDTTSPVLVVRDTTVDCDAGFVPMSVMGTDNCDAMPVTTLQGTNVIPGSCPFNFVTEYTWRITDNCGNFSDVVQTVTTQDTTKPVISGVTSATVPLNCGDNLPVVPMPTVTDNCRTVPLPSDPPNPFPTLTFSEDTTGSVPCNFTVTRKWVAEDECMNMDSVVITYNFMDTTPPVFVFLPQDIDTVGNMGSCEINICLDSVIAVDACEDPGMMNSFNACDLQTMTVNGSVPSGPMPNTPVDDMTFTFANPPMSPNGDATLNICIRGDIEFNGGTFTEFFEVFGENGTPLVGTNNAATGSLGSNMTNPSGTQCNTTCVQTSFLIPQAMITAWAGSGGALTFTLKNNLANGANNFAINSICAVNDVEACINYDFTNHNSSVTIVNSLDTNGAHVCYDFPAGDTTRVTFTAIDACGNQTIDIVKVFVADEEPPMLTCATPVVVCNDSAVCESRVQLPIPTLTENCGFLSDYDQRTPEQNFTFSPRPNLPPSSMGVADSLQFCFTNIPSNPVGVAAVLQVYVRGDINAATEYFVLKDENGNQVSVTGMAAASNTVSGAGQTATNPNAGCLDGGEGIASEYTLTTFTFPMSMVAPWIADGTACFWLCANDDAVALNFNAINTVDNFQCPGAGDTRGYMNFGFQNYLPSWYAFGATNIGDSLNQLTIPIDTVFAKGTTTIVYFAEDKNGNTDTCTTTVTVEDCDPPVAVCQKFIMVLNSCSKPDTLFPANIDAGSTDNCIIEDSLVIPNTFTCNDVMNGLDSILVDYIVRDCGNNYDTCKAWVLLRIAEPDPTFSVDCTTGDISFLPNPPNVGPHTFSWTGPNGFASTDSMAVVLNPGPGGSGTYCVTMTGAGGCVSTGCVNVFVGPAPGVPVVTSNNPTCDNEDLILTSTPFSGLGVVYNWFNDQPPAGPGATDILMASTVVPSFTQSPAISGTYYVQVTLPGGCPSSFSAPVVISTGQAPDSITVQGLTICEGEDIMAGAGIQGVCHIPSAGLGVPVTATCGLNSATPVTWASTQALTPSTGACNSWVPGSVITDIEICLDLNHTWTGDLDLVLISPSGTAITLMNSIGGSSNLGALGSNGATPAQYCFTTNPLDPPMGSNTSGVDNVPGNYQPGGTGAGSLTAFFGEDPNGTWATTIVDLVGGDGGTVGNIQMNITASPPLPSTSTVTTWWDAPTGGNLLWTGGTFAPNNASSMPPGQYQYYVECANNGCVSDRVPAILTITPKPATPAIDLVASACVGDTVCLTTSSPGVEFFWIPPSGSMSDSSIIKTTANTVCVTQAGDWKVMVRDANGCLSDMSLPRTVVFNPYPTAVITAPDTACYGTFVTLMGTELTGMSPASYRWFTSNPMGNPAAVPFASVSNPLVGPLYPNGATGLWYYLEVDVNGCTHVDSQFIEIIYMLPPSITDFAMCEGDVIPIGSGLGAQCASGTTTWWTQPTGGTYLSTGSTYAPTNAASLPTGTYEYWVQCEGAWCNSPRSKVTLTVNPIPGKPVIGQPMVACMGTSITLTTTAAADSFSWIPPAGPAILTTTGSVSASQAGNWTLVVYAGGCASPTSDPVNVQFTPIPSAAITADTAICAGDTLMLAGTDLNGLTPVSYEWFSVNPAATGATPFAFTQNVTVGPLSSSMTYWLRVTHNGCSDVSAHSVNITTPNTPTVTDYWMCEGDVIPIGTGMEALCAGQVMTWWSHPTGGSYLFTGDTYRPPNASTLGTNTYVYWVQCEATNGCVSPRQRVRLIVWPKPAAPAIDPVAAACVGDTICLTTSASADTFFWVPPSGSTSYNSIQKTTTNTLCVTEGGDWTLYISGGANFSCYSDMSAPVNVVFNPVPVAVATGPGSICDGDVASLNGSELNGLTPAVFHWFAANPMMNPTTPIISASANPTFGPLSASTTYWLRVTVNGCSDITSVTVNVNPLGVPVATTGFTVCEGDDVPIGSGLTAACSMTGSSITWYDSPIGGNQVGTGSVFTPANASTLGAGTHTWYAECTTVDGCAGARMAATLTITGRPATPQIVNNGPGCPGGSVVISTGVAAAQYIWTAPSGSTTTTTTPSLTVTAGGLWTLTVVDGSGCQSLASVPTQVIFQGPATPILTKSPLNDLCEGDALTLNVNSYSGTSVSYNWTTPTGMVSTTVPTLIINPVTAANSGVYTVSVSVDTCSSPVSNAVNVLVHPTPTTPVASNNGPVCEGDAITLTTGFVAGATYMWSGPNGFSSTVQNPTIPSATMLDAGTYFLTINSGGCGSASTTTVVSVSPKPAKPVIGQPTTACAGGTIVLSTIASADTFFWIPPSGGHLWTLSGSINVTQGGSWSLYVKNATGCISDISDPVNVMFTANPSAAITAPTTVCVGDTAQLVGTDLNSLSPVSYEWFAMNPTASGATPFAFLQSISVGPISTTTTYWLRITHNGCSDITSHTISTAVANTPVVTDYIMCEGDVIPLGTGMKAQCGGQVMTWWTQPTGGTYLITGDTYRPPNANTFLTNTYVYWVQCEAANGCVSPRARVRLVVHPKPLTPAIQPPSTTACEGDTICLTTSAIADTFYWVPPSGSLSYSSIQKTTVNTLCVTEGGDWSVYILGGANFACKSDISAPVNVVFNPVPVAVATGPSAVCAGDMATLNGSELNGLTPAVYHWFAMDPVMNPGAPIVSTAQNPVMGPITATTTRWLRVTVNGCEGVTSITINVNPATAPASTTGFTVCEGENVPIGSGLTATCVTTGSSITWYDAPVGGNVVGTGGLYTPSNTAALAAGVYTWYAECTTPSGCTGSRASVNLTVTPKPATPQIVNNGPGCVGDSVDISTGVMSTLYTWTAPSGATYVTTNSTLRVSQAGNWTVQVVNAAGCISDPSVPTMVSFTNVLTPTITSSASGPLCEGDVLTLNATAYTGSNVTYTWTTPSGTIVTNTPTLILNPVTASNTGNYSVAVTVGSCTSLSSNTVFVQVTATPSAPIAASNSPVCEGDAILLTTPNIPGATFMWSGPNGFVSTLRNPTIPNATALNAGAYVVVVTINGCSSAASAPANVVVNPKPAQPLITNNGPGCPGDSVDVITGAVAAQYIWTGPTGATYNTTTGILRVNQAGTWSVQVVNAAGCTSFASTPTVVTFTGVAVPTISTTATSPICEGDPLTISVAPSYGGAVSYNWTTPAGPVSTAVPTLFIGSVTAANSGVYSVSVSVNGCASNVSNAITIIVTPTPATPMAMNNTPVCAGDPILLSTPAIAGATYLWSGPNGFSSTARDPIIPVASLLDTGNYFVTVSINGCASAVSAATVVQVDPLPAVPVVTNNSPVCVGGTITLSVVGPSAGTTYEWYKTSTGLNIGVGSIVNISPAAVTDAGNYYAIARIGNCVSAASSATLVTVDSATLNVAFAGPNQALCDEPFTNLNATAPAQGSGMWSTASSAVIVNPTDPNSSVTGLVGGSSYTFTWTISNGVCGNLSSDDVTVSVTPTSTDIAEAGANQTLCEMTMANLSATAPTTSVGVWTQSAAQSAAGVAIANPSMANTSVSGLQSGGTYTFTWELSNGACGVIGTDEVNITIIPGSNETPFAGSTQFICDEVATLGAASVGVGMGTWTQGSGNSPATTVTSPNDPQTFVTDLQVGVNTFIWTVTNGVCGVVGSDTVSVIVEEAPVAVNDNYVTDLNEEIVGFDVLSNDGLANVSGVDVYVVSQPSNGTLLDDGTGTYTYVPNTNFIGVDSFSYEICSQTCDDVCSMATVFIAVNGSLICDVPNIITPNNDGYNDVLFIPCLSGTAYPNSTLMILNRWGDEVYNASPYNNDWNGTYNGSPLPEGTYFYILDLGDGSGAMTGYVVIHL